MSIRFNRTGIISKISTISVLIALISLSMLQYNWVTSSAEKDLTELYKSFSFRIFSAISEEFSMLPLLGERLDYLRDINNEEDLKNILINLYDQFKQAESYDYFNSISYIKYSDSENTLMIYSNNGWNDQKTIPIEISKNNRGLSLQPDESDKNSVWIVFPIMLSKEESLFHILIHFDILSFYQNEIEAALSEIENEYEVKWYYNQAGQDKNKNEWKYNYSPFNVLKNKLMANNTPWLIEIPLHIIMSNDANDRRSKLFFDPPGNKNIENSPPPSVYVDILYKGEPLIQSKEYSLTMQWLLSLFLLLGIGIAYLIVLYQINKLKQLRKREKEFVASVTHELRTPLTVINSAADNIKSGIVSPDRIEKYGHLITDQSMRLSSMIEGILLFSRLEGKAEQSPVLQPIYFNEIKKDLQVIIDSITENHKANINIDFGSLPDSALSDRETIELVLTNLISNSVKHAYKKNENIFVRIIGHLEMPHNIIFTVEDDGSGIDKKEKKHIFEPFFRGDQSFKEQIKGSGLGLYLSFRKVRLLSGSLKVSSPYERVDGKMREGCRFTMRIPYNPISPESENV